MSDQESQREVVDGSLLREMDKLDIGKSDSPASGGVKREKSPSKRRKRQKKSSNKDIEYEVDEVLDKRISEEGITSYKILWKGYPEDQASWVPQHNMDCSDLVDAYEKKNRTDRYQKRASNIYDEQWAHINPPTGTQLTPKDKSEEKPEETVKEKMDSTIETKCSVEEVKETESQLLAEYLALIDAGKDVVNNVPSWRQCFEAHEPLLVDQPMRALQALEDETGDLFLEMQWEDGMKMEVPFPVALKLYPKVFLPWFESYLNGEAAKEGCCRDDFLDENWEAKLRKSKENLGVDDMDVDPPEVSQTPLDVSVVSDTQPTNSAENAEVTGQPITVSGQTISPSRGRLILKIPRLLPKPTEAEKAPTGPNSPAYLSNEEDLTQIQDSIRTPPLPPPIHPSHPLTAVASTSPLITAIDQQAASTVASPALMEVTPALSLVEASPAPVDSLMKMPSTDASSVLATEATVTPMLVADTVNLLQHIPSPSPKRSGRPRKQAKQQASLSPVRAVTPRSILPKPQSGPFAGIESYSLALQFGSSMNTSRSSSVEGSSLPPVPPPPPPSPPPAPAEVVVNQETRKTTSEKPIPSPSSTTTASPQTSQSASEKPAEAPPGPSPKADETPLTSVPLTEAEEHRVKNEHYRRFVPLMNRCVDKLTADLQEKTAQLATLDTLLKERPEAREASESILAQKTKIREEMDKIEEHPLRRLHLLLSAGNHDNPPLKVLNKCIDVIERSEPWFESFIGPVETRKYFTHCLTPRRQNPVLPSIASLNNVSVPSTGHRGNHPLPVGGTGRFLPGLLHPSPLHSTQHRPHMQSPQQHNNLIHISPSHNSPTKYTGYVPAQHPQGLVPIIAMNGSSVRAPLHTSILHSNPTLSIGENVRFLIPPHRPPQPTMHAPGFQGGPQTATRQPLLRSIQPHHRHHNPPPQYAVRPQYGVRPEYAVRPLLPQGWIPLVSQQAIEPPQSNIAVVQQARKTVARPPRPLASTSIPRPPPRILPKT